MKRNVIFVLSLFCLLSIGCSRKASDQNDLSPAKWAEGELEKYSSLNRTFDQPHQLATGNKGMVAGTSGALAVRAGLEALKQGGSAADAVMTTALTQICLATGSWVSYAGFMTMVYYDAQTGRVHSMNTAYNTIREEDDPLSIPIQATPSGRATLVPGFMAGVQAAHDRFGKLPFAALFEPAIYFARKGFMVDKRLDGLIKTYKNVLTRRPETRKIFTHESGDLLGEGDLILQPDLAETLKEVSVRGADYMYRGEWANKFVEAVRKEGGKITLKDLNDYEAIWTDPVQTSFRNYDVFAAGLPSFGGVNIVEALNLLEVSNLPMQLHYTTSAELLYWLIQISRAAYVTGPIMGGFGVTPEQAKRYIPEGDFSMQSRTKKDTAKLLWEYMQQEKWKKYTQEIFEMRKKLTQEFFEMRKPRLNHSDSVVAVDEKGNVAAIVHTINGSLWGSLGLRLDGISVPTSASAQQDLINKVGPGVRLPDPTNPLIILKDGKPVLASGSIGVGLHDATFLGIVNILDYHMNPKEAVEAPFFMCPEWMLLDQPPQAVTFGPFSEPVLQKVRAMGQEIRQVPKERQSRFIGVWIVITMNPETRIYQGCVPPYILNGHAEGY